MSEIQKTDTVKKWYVIRAVAGQEKKIKQFIEVEISRIGMNDYVSQILIPTEKVIQIRNGKKVTIERNFYPGYILIEAAIVGEIGHTIKNVPNVIGFLGDKGGNPVPMRQSEVNRILGNVDALTENEIETINPYLIGDAVKVIDGPFNSFSGVIEEINEDKKKLKVMVKIFGRKTPLELNYTQVEKE
ncbi:MAG: transcription termination/antitermination factor NusG [Bacteroidia bacterium]|nr:transcription termination/antitermination factor NusG [Bacteroidia bacterium]